MKLKAAPREFRRRGATDRYAACLAGMFLAIASVLFRVAPVPLDGAGFQQSMIGSQVADFTLLDVDGKQVRLSDFRGKTVLLSFWATWCPPCKEELPALEKIYEQYKDKDVAVLAVDDEDKATIRDFLKEKQYGFTALVDSKRTLFKEFAVHFIPTVIVINHEGIITREVEGWEGAQQFLAALKATGIEMSRPARPESSRTGGTNQEHN
jgi:peroxiredoxin